jgi:hypothetical protein
MLHAAACSLVGNQVTHGDDWNVEAVDLDDVSLGIGVLEIDATDTSENIDATRAIADLGRAEPAQRSHQARRVRR